MVSKTQRRFNRFLMLISTSVLKRVSNYDLIIFASHIAVEYIYVHLVNIFSIVA